jgi:hypothetical protein
VTFDLAQPTGHRAEFPVGSRVVICTKWEDFHPFCKWMDTGVVVRHADRDYLGVIVRLDKPYRCRHGSSEHVVEEFNFTPRNLRLRAGEGVDRG